jgi:hypothetical protein
MRTGGRALSRIFANAGNLRSFRTYNQHESRARRKDSMKAAPLTLFVLAVFAVSAPVLGQGSGVHTDEQLGYKVRCPQGWLKMPLPPQERWIVAKYLCDREYLDKESGYGFKPEMRVVLFPHAVTEDRGVKKTTEGEGDDTTTIIEIKNPYKDYKDYLTQNYSGGGWSVSLEEEQKSGELAWTLLEIKVEKLAWAKKRIVTGIFHAEDADFAVQFEVLEDNYDKLKATVYGSLKSFTLIARQGPIAPTTTPGTDVLDDETKLTPEERKKRRLERQMTTFRKAKESLPAGWESFEYKEFLVLSHVDRKYAMGIVKQAEAVRNWLDATFPYLGDEYVRPPIIRICANVDEERSYFDGSGDSWMSPGREIVTHKDTGSGALSYEFEYVKRRIVAGWFADKDRAFSLYMPDWLDGGLRQYLGTSRLKGSNLEFKPDDWERERIREANKKGEMMAIRQMLLASPEEFRFSHESQAASLLRFLLEGPGRGLKESKTFLERYLKAVRDVADEWERKAEEELNKAASEAKEGPKTEEEEDEEFKNRGRFAQDWAEQRKKFLEEVFNRAFGGVKDADWAKMEGSYKQSVS